MSSQAATIGPQVGVLDLETLDTYDDAVILSGAIVVADITKRIPFEKLITPEYSWFFKLDSKEQVARGRSFSRDCLKEFWQSEDVKEQARIQSLYPDPERDISIDQFHDQMITQLHRLKGNDIHWFDRNSFDFSKLAHLYERTLNRGNIHQNNGLPFTPKNTWEISTVLQHLGQDRYAGIGPWHFTTRGMVYHCPVCDSALDWLRYQHALENVGLIEVTPL